MMSSKKEFIKNRKSQKIAILIDEVQNQKGLAFVMHGLGGFKEQPHIQAMADAFRESDYTAVRFDTTNTFGESDGNYEDATTTNYYEDLEDVIGWSESQPWYQEPFVLCGHSLGGICTALFAENYPDKVKALVAVSTVVSGKLNSETEYHKSIDAEWRRTGWLEEKSISLPGVVKRLKWAHMEDRMKYDLLKKVDKLTMSVMLLVGEKDNTTPLAHQQILYNALPGPKEFYVIKGAAHTFRKLEHLAELQQLFNQWIAKLS